LLDPCIGALAMDELLFELKVVVNSLDRKPKGLQCVVHLAFT
jgi:hypothetical protein